MDIEPCSIHRSDRTMPLKLRPCGGIEMCIIIIIIIIIFIIIICVACVSP